MKTRLPIIACVILALLLCVILYGRNNPASWAGHGYSFIKSAISAPHPPTFSENEKVIPGGPRRIYLFHGIWDDHTFWDDAPYSEFVKMRSDDQLVIVDLPIAQPHFFKDGGLKYCKAFDAWFRKLDAGLDRTSGRRQPKIAVGVSYGGLHAMLAAGRHSFIDAYAAVSPVIKMSALDEFWFVENDQCQANSGALRKKPGIVTYGTADDRVDTTLIRAFVRDAAPKAIIYPGRGHDVRGDEFAAINRWIGR